MRGLAVLNSVRISILVVMLAVVAGLTALANYLPQAMRNAAFESAVQGNVDIVNQVKLMRGYYTQNILANLLPHGVVKASMDYKNRPNEVPLPATLVKELSERMSQSDIQLSLVSPYPWPHRADRKLTEFEQMAWDTFQTDPNRILQREEVVDGQRVLKVAVADKMTSETCVTCHNTDPLSVRKDWKVGDVRAIFEVTRVIEPFMQAADLRSTYMLAAISLGAFVCCGALFAFLLFANKQSKARQEADQHAYYLAEHDVLTGLNNRARLREAIEDAFAQHGKIRYTSLLLIDLDRFKPVNDTYGHAIGDQLLQEVARKLRLACKTDDILARLGGDEFAVLLAGRGAKGALALAQRLCQSLAEPFVIDGQVFSIGASIGIAVINEHAGNTTDLLIAADLALYAAKGAGKGTARLFTPDLTVAALKRRHLEADLRVALDTNAFQLFYQQIGAIESGKVTKLEALLRWHHPERGMIPPVEFIPLAEESGLIVPIGAWVIRQACQEMAKIEGDLKVAVNLSAAQLKHESLIPTLKAALAESGLPPDRLEVEITESIMMDNDGRTVELLNTIRGLGVHIAMDDFGTGYSCLSYLQTYPIDCVKIDKSFVQTLGKEQNARPIIAAIIALARALGMRTVAEGVETHEQLLELAQLQCDEVQGYFFGKPKPMRDLRINGKALIAA